MAKIDGNEKIVQVQKLIQGALRLADKYLGPDRQQLIDTERRVARKIRGGDAGFVLVKPVTTFPLTVYVHGKDGPQDLVLRNSGDVLLDLGLDRRHQPIGSEGQAYFPAIPATFLDQEVPIGVQSDDFEVNDPNQKYRLDGGSVYLSVQKKAGHLSGHVQDESGNPIPGATIHVAGLSKVTDSAGHFEFVIPGDRLQPELELEVGATGYGSKHYRVVPNANEVVIQLVRAT